MEFSAPMGTLKLGINVLPGMETQWSELPVFSDTLIIQPQGRGNRISVIGQDGEPRVWYADHIKELTFTQNGGSNGVG